MKQRFKFRIDYTRDGFRFVRTYTSTTELGATKQFWRDHDKEYCEITSIKKY